MNDNLPPPLPPAETAAPPEASQASILRLGFPGTGREYFGIWIVNILLTIVTLGLYYPWARARRLQFFAGGTDIGGYRLAFTGVARQMFLGFSIAMLAFIIYTVAETFSPVLSMVVLVLFGAIWPWLMRAALRFRLAKTRWRGLPLAFTGSIRGAYAAFLPAIIFLAALLILAGLSEAFAESLDGAPFYGLVASFAIAALLGVAGVPWVHFRIKRYQQDNLAYASRQTRFTAGVSRFYGLYILTALLALGAVVAVNLVGLLIGGLGMLGQTFGTDWFGEPGDTARTVGTGIAITFYMLGAFLTWQMVSAFFVARLHNIVWSNTAGDEFAFAARLRFWPFLRLRIINFLMKIITLGLYIPFAQVALARIKLESVALAATLDLDDLINQAGQEKVSAGADAAADLFDLDIGL